MAIEMMDDEEDFEEEEDQVIPMNREKKTEKEEEENTVEDDEEEEEGWQRTRVEKGMNGSCRPNPKSSFFFHFIFPFLSYHNC